MNFTIWIDVEDLFEYALTVSRPSGIQRLSFQVYQALHQRDAGAGRIRFVRHAAFATTFRVVEWFEIARLFENLTDGEAPTPAPASTAARPVGWLRRMARELLRRLPAPLRLAVIDVVVTGIACLRACARLASSVARMAMRKDRQTDSPPLTLPGAPVPAKAEAFAVSAAPGDVLLVIGSPWSHSGYAALIQAQREKFGLRFALLVYDLIPLRRPEWCDASLTQMFQSWFDTVFPLCDHVFAISQATAIDVEAYAHERGMVPPRPILVLPIGTERDPGGLPAVAAPSHSRNGLRSPPPGGYALIVSTIEIRKNHLLLFRVWSRLLEELPRAQVPTLVFAGRTGWLVADLMQQIANTANLGGKLVLIESPTDAEIAALYAGCLFTLFPSFYEGWGLPVSESLAFGKPCLISNTTSLPEAGGTLARSFDPNSFGEAYTMIRDTILDRPGLAMWEARVRRDFHPVPWSATAEALVNGLSVAPNPK